MFGERYYPTRMFTASYFPKFGSSADPEPVTPYRAGYPSQSFSRSSRADESFSRTARADESYSRRQRVDES